MLKIYMTRESGETMSSWNVWQWLIIISIAFMVIIPTVIQGYTYLKGVKIKYKWWYIIGIWLFFILLIAIFGICWWQIG